MSIAIKKTNNNFVTAMLAIMAGITGGAVVADYMATNKYEAVLTAKASYPDGYNGYARVYARDLEEFEWSNYMDAVEWQDPEWQSFTGEGVLIEWYTNKMVCRPNQDPEPVICISVTCDNGHRVTTYRPATEIWC